MDKTTSKNDLSLFIIICFLGFSVGGPAYEEHNDNRLCIAALCPSVKNNRII